MVRRNENLTKLQSGYLFRQVRQRRAEAEKANPDVKVISLGVGDTPGPLTPKITEALVDAAKSLGTPEGYTGYRYEALPGLRESISERFYDSSFSNEEIFISDGSKCDAGRLAVLFGANVTIAVQDPTYPIYVDDAVILGQTDDYNKETEQFDGITYLSCTPENNFFPDFKSAPRTDLIYICSPNNPTGAVATKDQLKDLVAYAKDNKSIIIFDAAYAAYVKDNSLPKSIFEIPGAKEVAIELSSFSKLAGFTGVRLGWSVVPKELKFDDGTPVVNDWGRISRTFFISASNVVQKAGIKVLEDDCWQEVEELISLFLENAKLIKAAVQDLGFEAYAGENAPYVWVRIPGKTSWETFDEILNKAHIVCTPGSGFGAAGEGFVRFSAFGHRSDIEEAIKRLKEVLKN